MGFLGGFNSNNINSNNNPKPNTNVYNPQCQSLSPLPCQSVTPSYDPGDSVFVCVCVCASLSIYSSVSHICLFHSSLSPSLIPNSSSPNSPTSFCPFTLLPPLNHILSCSVFAFDPQVCLLPFLIFLPYSLFSLIYSSIIAQYASLFLKSCNFSLPHLPFPPTLYTWTP